MEGALPFGQGVGQGALVGEVAIDRADAHPGALGHRIGGEALKPVALQKLSCGLQNDVHRRGGPLLARNFSCVVSQLLVRRGAGGEGPKGE